jgi:hypothetical protein
MKLSEHPLGIEWLRHFDPREVHAARLFLDSLKLVSLEECEVAVSKMVEGIYSITEGAIGLFTIDKKIIDPTSAPGSEGRLAHLMRNLERQFRDRMLIKPTDAEMRERKVKHIIFIDDFVGSGQRVLAFWEAWASKTVKSWLSNRTCTLWLAGYAIHESGLNRIRERITYLKAERMRFEVTLRAGHSYWPDAVRSFCEENGARTYARQWPLGYGDLMCPLVFQHGCPDNCAAILWSNGTDFRALFPGRGVPHALQPCFDGSSDCGRSPELLWRAGQFNLALALIDDMAAGIHGSGYVSLLTILGLLLRGVTRENLAVFMTLERSQVETFLQQAQELGLLSDTFAVTPFGKDLVVRSKKSFVAPAQESVTSAQPHMYFPRQFQKQICGVQPKSRNEPA